MPLWGARIGIGVFGPDAVSPATLVIDGAILLTTIWAELPLMEEQGPRFGIRTEYKSMLALPLLWAGFFLVLDAWKLLTN